MKQLKFFLMCLLMLLIGLYSGALNAHAVSYKLIVEMRQLQDKLNYKAQVIQRLDLAEQDALNEHKPDEVALYRKAREEAESEYHSLQSRADAIKATIEAESKRESAINDYR